MPPIVFFVATLATSQATPAGGDRPVAIVHAVIIDGEGGTPIDDGVVVIRGERIAAIGRARDVSVPADAELIDADGGTVIPGLADMHVHLVGGWDGEAVDILGYQRYLNALLYSGVTTVLDTGNILPFVAQMRQAIRAGRIAGPRIYFVGPLVDGPDPVWPPISVSLVSTEQASRTVSFLASSGVDAVKAYGGLSAVQVRALAGAAREHSLPVIVDQFGLNGAEHLIQSGIRAFAHTPSQVTERTLELMRNEGVHVITTLAVTESFARRRFHDLTFLENDLIARTTPPWFLESLREEASRELTEEQKAHAQRTATRLEQAKENVKRLFEAGVVLAAGTDAPYPGVFQGEGIHRELELLVEAGLTPLEAISIATRNAARLVDEADDWGTLATGRQADLLLVRGRPDLSISDTRNVEIVIQGGRVLDRQALIFDASSDPGFRVATPVSSN